MNTLITNLLFLVQLVAILEIKLEKAYIESTHLKVQLPKVGKVTIHKNMSASPYGLMAYSMVTSMVVASQVTGITKMKSALNA